MSADILLSYGMQKVADVHLIGNRFWIDIIDDNLAGQPKSIYAFLVMDEIVRVGSSKQKLAYRLKRWERDVTAALEGKPSVTPTQEAQGWKVLLAQNSGAVYARPGAQVATPVGIISTYLAEEAHLIDYHKPRFCRR